jgi:hypothetical protein
MDERPGKRPSMRRATATAWSLGLLLSLPVGAAPPPQVRILVNPAQAAFPLDREFVRAVFAERIRAWPDGTSIRVFVLPDTDVLTDLFDRSVLHTYPYVLRTVWDRMAFTGTGLPPTVVLTEEDMRQRVMSTPGAIGYVRGDSPVDGGGHS